MTFFIACLLLFIAIKIIPPSHDHRTKKPRFRDPENGGFGS